VDDAIGATQGLEGRNLPRAAAARTAIPAPVRHTYARKRSRNTVAQDLDEIDDEEQDQQVESDSATPMDEDEESAPPPTATADGHGGFHFNDDLLY